MNISPVFIEVCFPVSCLQVALLDFGATRGFDKSFTDIYIEVRSCGNQTLSRFIVLR